MTAEAKLRTLAAQNAPLLARLGPTPFRWFDVQLDPGYVQNGTCVRVRRISTTTDYLMSGRSTLNSIRFQIDVLDFSGETTRAAAAEILAFLDQTSLASNNQFGSPPTTPPNFPTFLLNQRTGMEPNTKTPVFVTILDVRLYNLEN